MADCSTVSTPMTPGLVLTKDVLEIVEHGRYLSAIGSLLYLSMQTRPDIAFAVAYLARFSACPGEAHWKAVKHLFRYIRGTLDYRITYSKSAPSSEPFLVYSDAAHGDCKESGKSTSGYLVMAAGAPVSWRSKLQTIVALSTTEAEYVAGVNTGKELKWMRNLFTELGYGVPKASTLLMDNQSGIAVAKNPEHHGRMKQLDLAHYWLRDEVAKGYIQPEYIQTEFMLADIMTKPLTQSRVLFLKEEMGMRGSFEKVAKKVAFKMNETVLVPGEC